MTKFGPDWAHVVPALLAQRWRPLRAGLALGRPHDEGPWRAFWGSGGASGNHRVEHGSGQ